MRIWQNKTSLNYTRGLRLSSSLRSHESKFTSHPPSHQYETLRHISFDLLMPRKGKKSKRKHFAISREKGNGSSVHKVSSSFALSLTLWNAVTTARTRFSSQLVLDWGNVYWVVRTRNRIDKWTKKDEWKSLNNKNKNRNMLELKKTLIISRNLKTCLSIVLSIIFLNIFLSSLP